MFDFAFITKTELRVLLFFFMKKSLHFSLFFQFTICPEVETHDSQIKEKNNSFENSGNFCVTIYF